MSVARSRRKDGARGVNDQNSLGRCLLRPVGIAGLASTFPLRTRVHPTKVLNLATLRYEALVAMLQCLIWLDYQILSRHFLWHSIAFFLVAKSFSKIPKPLQSIMASTARWSL